MRVITNMAELMEVLESADYGYYGLRGATEKDMGQLERGYLDCSHNWYDGEMLDEMLDGTCAIGVNEYHSESEIRSRYDVAYNRYAKGLGTNTVLLIAGKREEYGEDENEVILSDKAGNGADVIAIVKF